MNRTGEIITGAWQCIDFDDLPDHVIAALGRAVTAVMTDDIASERIDQAVKEAHEK